MKTLLKYLEDSDAPKETKLLVYETQYKQSKDLTFRTPQARKEYVLYMTKSYLSNYDLKNDSN